MFDNKRRFAKIKWGLGVVIGVSLNDLHVRMQCLCRVSIYVRFYVLLTVNALLLQMTSSFLYHGKNEFHKCSSTVTQLFVAQNMNTTSAMVMTVIESTHGPTSPMAIAMSATTWQERQQDCFHLFCRACGMLE